MSYYSRVNDDGYRAISVRAVIVTVKDFTNWLKYITRNGFPTMT